MALLFVVAGLTPLVASFGYVFWLKLVRHDPAAADLAGGVAIGLAAGALFGLIAGLGLILLVIAALHAAR